MSLVEQLQSALPGQVSLPGSSEYDRRTACYNQVFTPRPVAVVSPTDAAGLSKAVTLASDHDTGFGVHLTGHGIASDYEGRVMFTLDALDTVVIDAAGSAVIGAGAVWADVVAKAAQFGLAPPCGSSSGVGATGYTMGGGIGNLGRRYGYAADNVTAIDLVLADGRQTRATADQYPDLFWGVRGSKSGLGIVTSFEISLFPVPSLFGGSILWPATQTDAVLQAFAQWSRALPDEISTSVAIIRFPDLDDVPAPLRGRTMTALRVAYLGAEADGSDLLAPMRAVPGIEDDNLRMMTFPETDTIHADPTDPATALEWNGLLGGLGEQSIQEVSALMNDPEFGADMVEIRLLGGQLDREPSVANCVGSRGAVFNAFAAAILPPSATHADEDQAGTALDRVAEAFRGDLTQRTMLNFVGARQGSDLTKAWPPESLDRLRALKRQYDPAGLLAAPFA